MKRILAWALSALFVFALFGCSPQQSGNNSEPVDTQGVSSENVTPEDRGTIMWLSTLTSGPQYDAILNYMTAVCDALGYEVTVVYADSNNDAAGNLQAVRNGMTNDVVGLIAGQDGGLASIMDEYPELYVIGLDTDLRSVFAGGEKME